MFRSRLSSLFPLPDDQLERLESHYRLLVKWNRVINLTRVDDEDEAAVRHFGEAIFLARCLPVGPLTVVDVGSGGGFPGLPVAVVRPECAVTLIESDLRKSAFLKEATRGWPNCRVLGKRAEAVTETFDWVVSRAVSWDDLRRFGQHLSPRTALLSTEPSPSGAVWTQFPLPWDANRYVVCST